MKQQQKKSSVLPGSHTLNLGKCADIFSKMLSSKFFLFFENVQAILGTLQQFLENSANISQKYPFYYIMFPEFLECLDKRKVPEESTRRSHFKYC